MDSRSVMGVVARAAAALTVILATLVSLASRSPASPSAPSLYLLRSRPSTVLAWNAPSGAVVGYVVMESRNGTNFSQVSPVITATTFTPAHLRGGASYEFVVIAELKGGAASSPSNVLSMTVEGAPGAPRGVHAHAGASSAVVSWRAPLRDGGRPITGYEVTASPGGARCHETTNAANLGATLPGPLQHCVVRGLGDGVAYYFSVVAVNAVGAGPSSAWSNRVRPERLPSTPSVVRAQPLDGEALVWWRALTTTKDTTYRVSTTPGVARCRSRTTSCLVRGLRNGVTYVFRVVAINAAGESATSSPSPGVRTGAVTQRSVGPFLGTTVALSTTQRAQVEGVASDVVFAGATFVSLVGESTTLEDARREARVVLTELTKELTARGVRTVVLVVRPGIVTSTRRVLVTIS